jgi:dipeptidyl aminopeptidase/acylaminoacyl peptidase
MAKAVHASLDWQGDRLVALRTGGKTPTQLVSYDTAGSGPWDRTILARGPVAGFEAAMVEPDLVTFPSADGVVLHARLYRSVTSTQRLICWVHGGPTDQWPVEFNARMAFFLARGWSILVPDHRGSTGHGRAYTQAMRHRWGELDAVDVISAIDAAAEQSWGTTIALMGGSAGGFTVLNVASMIPGLVSAAVVLYPAIDLVDFAAATHRFEAHYCTSLVGPLPESAALYRERSVDPTGIFDPLLVLHGDGDEVVPVSQSRELVATLLRLGRQAELVEYADEGHGWRRPATMIDELTRVEAFLDAHCIGGAP